jgi:dienelactone hydrolase
MTLRAPLLCLALLIAAPGFVPAEEAPQWPLLSPSTETEPLPGTSALTEPGDLSRKLHDANDRFLDREIERAAKEREKFWKRDLSSPEAYAKSVQPNRERLARMLGIDRETRFAPEGGNRLNHRTTDPGIGEPVNGLTVQAVEWRAFAEVDATGWLYLPAGEIRADLVVVPDADAIEPPRWIERLAQNGCRVLVPRLVDRGLNKHQLSHREWVHRSAFLLGRTMSGYEVLEIQSAIDCLLADQGGSKRPLGIVGHGEGGRLALFTAALDERIDAVAVSGAFGPREGLWREPADRNVFGLVREFGDAELAGLIAPRPLVIEHGTEPAYGYRAAKNPEIDTETRGKIPGKPGRLPAPSRDEVTAELARLRASVPFAKAALVESASVLAEETLSRFFDGLGQPLLPATSSGALLLIPASFTGHPAEDLVLHNRLALIDAAADRTRYFADLKTDSLGNFKKTIEPFREKFRTEVIGDFERPLLPAKVRTRPYQVGDKTLSYEVVMDVMESGGETVFAYGILTLPKDLDLSSGEKRPVIVCQHGLEGTPQDVIGEAHFNSYAAFATRLAERGFITFAPQNGYKYFDLFRMQQFKAQSIGKTLFSIIVPQHRQITNWLAAQPWVDPDKIAFYGLSYGGKSAMRIPPLVERYCLSICSADFNEWVWKNAATDAASLRYSYANKGEYEIFEWNLGGTFNYAEMAALICPRPFMVERGHFDGVGPDEQVAFEFAKVKNLYEAKLGLMDRCEIEWFLGPHTINGKGTYDFLHHHLRESAPQR